MAIPRQNFNRGGPLINPLAQFGQQLGSFSQRLLDREDRRERAERDAKAQEQLMGIRAAQEERAIAEADRVGREREATRTAQQALLNPTGFTQAQLSPEERTGLATSLQNLSPADASATQRAVEQGFVNRALLGENVDTRAVGDLRNQLAIREEAAFNRAVRTPGTPEYTAAQEGQLDLFKQRERFRAGLRPTVTKDNRTTKQKDYEFLIGQGVNQNEAYARIFGGKSSTKKGSGYSVKDIDKLKSTIEKSTFIGGDREDLLEKETQLVDAARKNNISSSMINNALGTAITTAKDGDTVDIELFETTFRNSIADQAQLSRQVPQPAQEVREEPARAQIERPLLQREFELPKTGATAVRREIINKIKGMRKPLFGAGIIDSAIKEQIDAEYGIGAFERFQKQAN